MLTVKAQVTYHTLRYHVFNLKFISVKILNISWVLSDTILQDINNLP